MSYTTSAIVKRHVPLVDNFGGERSSATITLSGVDWSIVAPGALEASSETVKAVIQLSPSSEEVTFSSDIVSLSEAPLKPASVSVANNSSLSVLYIESVDFLIDYENGKITRISSGAILSGAKVTVWRFPYKVYSSASDYDIDYARGRVRRRSGSSISDGQTVEVDYKTAFESITDEIVDEATIEANRMVEAAVDPSGEFGADLNLQSAATYLAASILSRVAAAATLGADGPAKSAETWLTLAQSFRDDAERMLKRFKPSGPTLTGPINV